MPHPHRALYLIARPGDGELRDEILELRESTLPDVGEGQLRVATRYISVDPAMRVWMTEAKSYWPPVELGAVMRAQAIGEVVESRHAKYPVGAWVSGMIGVQDGLVSDGKGLRVFDPRMLPDPAWALSVFGATGMTAWFGLHDIGRIQSGEVVVVSAAAGAVGSAAVQFAKAHGCRVIGIAGGPDKCAYVRDTLGADEAIDYKAGGIGKALSAACPDGIDVYFDNVGGETLDAVLKRLRLKARIVLCGGISQYGAAEVRGPANYLSMISARARMEGFVVIDYLHRAEEAIATMAPWAAAGKLTSKLDIVEGLDNFAAALRRVYSGANFGKQWLKV
ncbi:MAG: NADP-dependent oxidoreductase [Arenimonas sp.]